MLLGTFAYEDPAAGQALVGATAQSAALFAANAEIAPGVTLREIYASYVVIERDGVREILNMAERGGGQFSNSSRAPPGEPPAVGMHDTVRVAAAAADELRGIRVYAGRNRNGLAQLGLHPGDLVTEINGVPIGGQQSIDILGLIKDGSATTATVLRAGRLQRIALHNPAMDPATATAAASAPAAAIADSSSRSDSSTAP